MATITPRTLLPLREWDKRRGAESGVSPQWHRSAPSVVASANNWDVGSEGWTSWSAYLADRRRPRVLTAITPSRRSPLLWALPIQNAGPGVGRIPDPAELIALLDRVERKRPWKGAMPLVALANDWANEALHRRHAAFGLECVAWGRALPALSALVPADAWWRLFELLLCFAEDALAVTEGDVLSRQWLAAELPLVLAYSFPEIAPARGLGKRASLGLAAEIESLVGVSGMPAAEQLPTVLPLLATWARSRAIAERLKKQAWSEATENRYVAFARQALRLTRRDGTTAFALAEEGPLNAELLSLALAGAPRATRALARELVPHYDGPKMAADRLPPAAANDEAAGVSILRPSWTRGREHLVVARHADEVRTELSCGRDILWSGHWACEVRRNGVLLTPAPGEKWEELCWTTNEDVDYLELGLELSDGTRVERQVLIARDDRFVFLADAVLGDEPAALEYRGVLPIGPNTTFDPASESREGYLVGRKARALVFPLRLPEWRDEPCAGALEFVDRGLELRVAGHQQRLYAPLFIDLDPRRLFRPATWRSLTVGETRQVVAADVAVSYRVQIRDEQWLIYRSLGERGNRTMLGQNLSSEFLVAQFDSQGDIAPLLEIE